ncbi:NADAR family protein [Kutzneria buriramensis]|nr:NADAR family protein [Kutzneria buriramensis]
MTRITHRIADGVRVPGAWRHAFINNGGTYFLTDLIVYADGLIDCWGLVTVEQFERKVRGGWVATSIPDGARASAYGLASWRFKKPQTWSTPDTLLAEVADTIDELNGRPDSVGRCLAAVSAFLDDRTEENRAAVRETYLAIPETVRRQALGDMDRGDEPLQALAVGPGGTAFNPEGVVTQEEYDRAVAYFDGWIFPGQEPDTSEHAPAIKLPQGHPPEPLRNDFPAPIMVDGTIYPSVSEACQALPALNTAAMAGLLRAKFDQHPDLAEALLATGEATLLYDDIGSEFWGDNSGHGRNWMGRLLELVRDELRLTTRSSV